jgi:LacI family transcriptional regulator
MLERTFEANPARHPAPRVTLAHVADRAGVSTATASLILSGREEYIKQFRVDTVDKVRRSAKRLGYRANLFAAGLPTKAPAFFVLVIRDFGGRQHVHDWHLWAFEGKLLAGAVRLATEKGLYPIVATIDPDASDAGIASTMRIITGGVLGAIVRAQNPPLEKFLREQIKLGHRVVVVFPDQISRWSENAIVADNLVIGETAARLLAAQGRKRWGIVRYRQRAVRESHALRSQGFQQFAERAGVPVETVFLPRNPDEVTDRDIERVRKQEVDGLFAVDSVLSVDVLLACRKAGLNVGEDLSLVGVNCSQWRTSDLPSITSIDVSWDEVGKIAVRQLVQMSETNQPHFQSILVEPTVVPGTTCPVPETLLAAPVPAASA